MDWYLASRGYRGVKDPTLLHDHVGNLREHDVAPLMIDAHATNEWIGLFWLDAQSRRVGASCSCSVACPNITRLTRSSKRFRERVSQGPGSSSLALYTEKDTKIFSK